MPFFFEIDGGLNYTLEILVDPETLSQELSAAFKRVIETAASISQVYGAVVSKAGKILGQERTQLIEDLDGLFTRLVVLYAHFQRGGTERARDNLPLRVPIEVRRNKFLARGSLTDDDVKGVTSFIGEFNGRVVAKIKSMLVEYREAVADGTIDDGEYRSLFRTLDGILYDILILRYSIKSLLVDQ
jgi:hypothetical protein